MHYVCFIVYFMISKINLMQTAICYVHAKCLQHSKRLTHIIRGTFHPFGSSYLIFKIINTLPMYIYIINLMHSKTLTYNKSNTFIIISIKIVHLIESMF